MKRVLVITDPPAAPGYLPRVRYMCEYLVRKGYDVTMLTEAYMPLRFAHSYPIHTIPMYSGSTIDWFVKTVWTLLTDWHNRVFARKFLTANSQDAYELVICSAFSDFPLGAARRIAEYHHAPLICDIRDLEEQVDNSRYQYHHRQGWLMPFRRLYNVIHRVRRNRVLRSAQAVTTVSPWHADLIRTITGKGSAVSVVYNGYDSRQFYPEDIRAEQFTIGYIGSLHAWQEAGLEKVREAVDELNKSESIPSKIILDIHTPTHQPIAHDRLGDAIRRSSIMLVLTDRHTHGMLTTKFYEALGCQKPVLCVPSDEGALAELIQYTHAGLATDDAAQIKAFITEKYHEWQQQGYTRQATQHSEEFSREAQCAQLEKVIPANIK